MLVLFLLVLSGPAHATPTEEQMSWFVNLSSEEAGKAMRTYQERKREEHWKTVKSVSVVEIVRTSGVRDRDPVDNLGWDRSASIGESVTIWWMIETPKNVAVPIKVQIRWSHGGELRRLETPVIDTPSPAYRLWDMNRVREVGTWTVEIVAGGELLATQKFSVY